MSLILTACGEITDEDRQLAPSAGVFDATEMNDIILNFGDPNEAIIYFQTQIQKEPGEVMFRRGLAKSLIKAKRHAEAVLVLEHIEEIGEATNEDRLDMADAYIRGGGWDEAQEQLNTIPPTYETYNRYRLEAIVADHNKDWDRADSFYDIARGLTTSPANILNNWGFSYKIRGQYSKAADLFRKALRANPDLFTAKTNLVEVRAMQGIYRLPVIPMTDPERAVLLFRMGLIATESRDYDVARGLFQEAIDTHPQHFEAAVAALAAINNSVGL